MCPPRGGLGIPDRFCRASAPPPAHTLEFTLTRIHTRVGTAPPCPGQLGCRSPATDDSRPHPPGGRLGHTQPPFSPSASNTSSVFPAGAAPSPEPACPPSLAARPAGRPRRGSFLSGAQGSLSLVTRLLSKPALNGCLFMAQSLARCTLGSSAPASVCQEAVGPAVATTEAREPEGAGEAPLRKSLPGPGQRPPHTYKDSSHTLPSASSAALSSPARHSSLSFPFY